MNTPFKMNGSTFYGKSPLKDFKTSKDKEGKDHLSKEDRIHNTLDATPSHTGYPHSNVQMPGSGPFGEPRKKKK